MIGCALQRVATLRQITQYTCQFKTRRDKDGKMIEAGCAGRWFSGRVFVQNDKITSLLCSYASNPVFPLNTQP